MATAYSPLCKIFWKLQSWIDRHHCQPLNLSKSCVDWSSPVLSILHPCLTLTISWLSRLPWKLPANVKFIISALPEMYGILDSARFIGLPDSNFVPVELLNESTAWSIIDYWLNTAQRTVSFFSLHLVLPQHWRCVFVVAQLTESQRSEVSRALSQKSVTALYVKLVYDIIISWKSYTAVTELPGDVISCLDRLFDKMESDHGV